MSDDDGVGDLMEELNNLHAAVIREYKAEVKKKIAITLTPFLCGVALYLVSILYLLPSGLISEGHADFTRYEPVTMTEINVVYYVSQLLSIFIGIRFLQDYLWNVRTIPVHDGDRTRDVMAIGSIETAMGKLYLGRRMGERFMAPPTEYTNREGITFSCVDQAELLNLMRYLHRQDHLSDRAFRSATSRYQRLTVSMRGDGSGE